MGEGVVGLAGHEHACVVHETTEEGLAQTASFLGKGLEGGERCLLVADDALLACTDAALRNVGVDLAAARRSRTLLHVAHRELRLDASGFAPGAMPDYVERESRRATAEGVVALRVAVSMSWTTGCAPDAAQVARCERALEAVVEACPVRVVCLYDRRGRPVDLLRRAIHCHPVVTWQGEPRHNPFFVPPGDEAAGDEAEREVAWQLASMLTGGKERRKDEGGESRILPICSGCKRIREKDNRWVRLEGVLYELYGAQFSHGICPACVEKLYGWQA